MNDIELFRQWNKMIFRTQDENGLVDLYYVDGHASGSVMSDILHRKKLIHPIHYSIFKLHDEFITISKNMKYVTGILFFLKPHIIDTEESDGRYIQNLEDGRYLFYCTAGIGIVYSFWDRIGDLLHHYLPTNIKPKRVYYEEVMNAIPTHYHESDNYKKLDSLYKNTKETLLRLRNEVIHHFQIENIHYWGNIEFHDNDEERNKLNAEKFSYPERMKKSMELSNEAFFTALKLIDELPDDDEIVKLVENAATAHEKNP